jgi:hypothetical protein
VRRAERGSSLLEAVAALAAAALILGRAATQGMQSASMIHEARSASKAITLGRNVLDRALAAPCAAAGYAAAVCADPYRCTVAAEPLGQRVRPDGTVTIARLTVEVLLHRDGAEDRRLVRLATVGARPLACA